MKVTLIASLALNGALVRAWIPQAGRFSESCTDIKIDAKTNIISANCKNHEGNVVAATTDINPIFEFAPAYGTYNWRPYKDIDGDLKQYCSDCYIENRNRTYPEPFCPNGICPQTDAFLHCQCLNSEGVKDEFENNLNLLVTNYRGNLYGKYIIGNVPLEGWPGEPNCTEETPCYPDPF
ncbi:hypothetical protein F4808DRAFT_34872 [Astrocystis sublimbata]|nr:hypothetical protein F4808DRAFT_34872 [Astrocystis sublimbata]